MQAICKKYPEAKLSSWCQLTNMESTMNNYEQVLGFTITNQWFIKHHASLLSEKFCQWWVKCYGQPSEYISNADDSEDEYYTRMAFALTGWNAALCN